MGLAVAVARDGQREPEAGAHQAITPWCRPTPLGESCRPRPSDRPLVLDLSSLWAGPLCGQLLSLAGARVVKLESRTRPDGARVGHGGFFDLMNGAKASVALDFSCHADLQALRQLLRHADIVIESSRPRALRQLGIEAEASLRQAPGQVWLSLTGYGRRPPQDAWVAFGDDAAVAAGLCLSDDLPDAPPLFCGDAIADPLTGLHAAVAALASWRAGGGMMLDVAMCEVVRHAMNFDTRDPQNAPSRGGAGESLIVRPLPKPSAQSETGQGSDWEVAIDGDTQEVRAPRARNAEAHARPHGADTAEILAEFRAQC